MSPLHVTIVGGTGFVGRHLADRLLRAGHRLTLVARHCPSSGAAARAAGLARSAGRPLRQRPCGLRPCSACGLLGSAFAVSF
ncbi:MAG: NAD-dependent epimerase/dehydratase family protein [Chromatiaceae bacterium]